MPSKPPMILSAFSLNPLKPPTFTGISTGFPASRSSSTFFYSSALSYTSFILTGSSRFSLSNLSSSLAISSFIDAIEPSAHFLASSFFGSFKPSFISRASFFPVSSAILPFSSSILVVSVSGVSFSSLFSLLSSSSKAYRLPIGATTSLAVLPVFVVLGLVVLPFFVIVGKSLRVSAILLAILFASSYKDSSSFFILFISGLVSDIPVLFSFAPASLYTHFPALFTYPYLLLLCELFVISYPAYTFGYVAA